MSRFVKPEWWPCADTGPDSYIPLLTIVADLIRGVHFVSSKEQQIKCLSFACRNWIGPSTEYEAALYRLCFAAIQEVQDAAARAAAKEAGRGS